jgi:uncharacterized iron-regulated membrane protein
MIGAAASLLILALIAGCFMAWNQRRMQSQVAALPPAARKRMRTVFPAVMVAILLLTFIVVYLMSPRA